MKRMRYIVGFLAVSLLIAIACAVLSAEELYAMQRLAQDNPEIMPEELFQDQAAAPPTYEMTEKDLAEEQYWDSLELLALCVTAEAGGESELGKRLVIDTVLNRVVHPDFPDTVWEVITDPGAFTSYQNGQIDKVEPTQEIFRLVSEELAEQTNTEVLYFTAGEWPDYGTPLLREGRHYFNGEGD